MRLLTSDEKDQLINLATELTNSMPLVEVMNFANAVAKAQDAKTLKMVGEWLKKKYKGKASIAPLFVVPIYSMDLEALKRGEWPEEGK